MDVPATDVPQFIHLVQWGFYGGILFIGFMILREFDSFRQTIIEVRREMQELNASLIRIVEKSNWHERELENQNKELEKQAARLSALEQHNKGE